MEWLPNILFLFGFMTCAEAVSVLSGNSVTIECSVTTANLPSWSFTNSLGSQDISFEGTSSILGAFTYLQYSSNNRDLFISSAASSHSGNYTCSVSTGGGASGIFVLEVEVLTVNSVVWPETNGSYGYLTTACQTGASVEWYAIFTEKDNEERKICNTSTLNSTGCSSGKNQLTTGFDYKPCEDDCQNITFKYNLLHSSTGDTPQANESRENNYKVKSENGCCSAAEICVYLFFATEAIASLIAAVICIINWKELGKLAVIFIISAGVLLVVGIAWFIPLRVSVLPVLPEGVEGDCIRLDPYQFGDQCECGHPIAFAVIMAFLTCVGGAIAGYIIYIVKQESNKGQQQTSNPLITCMTACKTAPACSAGDSGEEEKSSKKKKHGIQETGDATPTNKPRPQPEPPKEKKKKKKKNKRPPADLGEHLQTKDPLPGIQGKKSSGREDSAVSRSDVQVHHRDHLSDDDHPHNRTQRGLSATIDQGQLPKLPPIDSTEKKSKRK